MAQKKFCVIGLGYFGLNLALRLSEAGAEVLAIDNKQDIIDKLSDKVTHAVCMDAADIHSLKSLDIQEMDAVVLSIGEGFESSLNTTVLLQELGVKKIYNRVISTTHERLLKLMNIHDMLLPEAEAAAHLARRLMIPGVLETHEISDEFSIFEIVAPENFAGKKLIDLHLRQDYSLNLVTIKKIKKKRGLLTQGEREHIEVTGVPSPDLMIHKDDILVLFGKEKDVKRLLNQHYDED